MGEFGIGQPVRRKEDQRFLTGHGRYVDDIELDGQAYGLVVRSPHAHAEIRGIATTAAGAAPGVLGVFTGADLAADGVPALPCMAQVKCRGGSLPIVPPRRALALDRVRHVGDPVAFIVADSPEQARDAAELLEIDYAPLPGVTDTERAARPEAPQLWPEAAGNVSFVFEKGDAAAVEAAFAEAAHVTVLELVNNRVVVAPLEPRAAIGAFEPGAGSLTLWVTGQGVHSLRRQLAERIFNLPQDKIRVIAPDVGGGFGMKNFLYPEWVLVLWAARRLGRPVKWLAERAEDFLTDTQGRDNVTRAELALDGDGRFRALRVRTIANMGAYLSTNAPHIPTNATSYVMGGVYDIPAVFMEVTGVFSNTVPVDAYRGAGRPEAAYVIERLVDLAAAELALDRFALRRRNVIKPAQFPYRTAMGMTVDSGEFQRNLDLALEQADIGGFAARRAAASRQGRLCGIGLASYFEATLGVPQEAAELRFNRDGTVSILAGTQSNGQGHETSYAQLVTELLGVPFDRIRYIQADTGLVSSGAGHGGSRSLQLGGGALLRATEAVREKGHLIAAHLLEAAPVDIAFEDGHFVVAGTDRRVDLLALAEAARDPANLPPGLEPGLDARGEYSREAYSFPNGCHVAEVEIDPDTGTVAVRRYAVVDDFGRVINPLLVEGQVHGGIAQGIGQALLEHTVYDGESGQLLSGSFMDYCLPRADDMPETRFSLNEVPTATNPLGVKGCGEAGCIGALPAVMNAIVDALSDHGVRHVDMPATPERLWRLLGEIGAR